jgi:hypothetical protein
MYCPDIDITLRIAQTAKPSILVFSRQKVYFRYCQDRCINLGKAQTETSVWYCADGDIIIGTAHTEASVKVLFRQKTSLWDCLEEDRYEGIASQW